MNRSTRAWITLFALAWFVPAGRSPAQLSHIAVRPPASNVLIPQSRARAFAPERQDDI